MLQYDCPNFLHCKHPLFIFFLLIMTFCVEPLAMYGYQGESISYSGMIIVYYCSISLWQFLW